MSLALTNKQSALQQRLRLHVWGSAVAGAASAALSAVLIAYAILDIEHRLWAQWLYTVVYALSAVVFATRAGVDFLPEAPVRWAIVTLCAVTAALSHLAPSIMLASLRVRVLALTAIGTGLGASLLVSTLVLVRLTLEARGLLPQNGAMADGLLNTRQLFILSICALVEGAYFGLAICLADARSEVGRWRLVALPHEAPAVVFPFVAALGGTCGMAVEQQRQHDDSEYVRGVELQLCGASGGVVDAAETEGLLAEDNRS
mmetsp:Transcript_48891/g.113331  ORF Transcript_48891/g.113331 Transcript_48891/m.113331 type:complete len:259 (+) Transcript_48891:103-879(+)